jgi:hypothetical protein
MQEDRWSAVIWGIANSPAFTMGIAGPEKTASVAQVRER